MSEETNTSNLALGVWFPDSDATFFDLSQAAQALQLLNRSVAVVVKDGHTLLAVGGRTQSTSGNAAQLPEDGLPLLAWLPSFSPARLGHPGFLRDHQVSWPLVAGAMANGIASSSLVEACAHAGILSFFGAGGLAYDQVEAAVQQLSARLRNKTWGVNLIHSPQEPALEARVGTLLSASQVPVVEASAYLDLTLPLVLLRARGLKRLPDGSIQVMQRIMGKVSRAEVARKFLSPPPAGMLAELVQRGDLTESQAQMASQISMCDDLTAEADSGGHTDNRPLVVLLPALQALQEQLSLQHPCAAHVRLGAGGGIGTPAAMHAAFSLGAAYVVTGSVNQCTREAGTSSAAKALLAKAAPTDVTMAPAADMFELGVNLQVLSRGTLFPVRARKLYDLYRRVSGLDGMTPDERTALEGILGATLETVWSDCETFFAHRDPVQLERAQRDAKHKLALICRWYLGRASRLAIDGIAGREQDYQIWCGPAMGAFNAWVRASWLEAWENRSVVACSHALLIGAAAQARQAQLRLQGVSLGSTLLPPPSESTLATLLPLLHTQEKSFGAPGAHGVFASKRPEAPDVKTSASPQTDAQGAALSPHGERSSESTGPQPGSSLEPIAIVGIGSLFPKAPDLKSFWRLLRTGQDAVGEIPSTHWSPADYFDPDPKAPDMTYAKRGAFLDPYPFDPTAFGIPPGILEATDTAQLLGLVVARAALADAGYTDQGDWPRARTSVLLGVTGTQELVIPLGARLGHPHWRRALQEAGVGEETQKDVLARIGRAYVGWQESSFPGLLGNVVAGRIANRLNLGGTNSVVDAACASSLAALHLACLELSSGRCDIALSGGVDALNDIFMHMCFSKTPALSPTGDVRPFDAAADGTLLGEGIGIVVLRRLSDAQRDGQRIYAVLKGIGTSSDGRAKSIYAPLPEGQARALRAAYAVAGVSPKEIGLVEAHGTGTKAGDVCEVQALKDVYQSAGVAPAHTALGSVKSQVGHTKAAAGVAGLIKAALAIHHRVIPPTIKVLKPNPALGLEGSPFYLPLESRPWVQHLPGPRRAAVSAFGFGGSNFHAVLEAHSQDNTLPAWDGSISLCSFSGDDWTSIRTQVRAALEGLMGADHAPWEQVALEQQSRRLFQRRAHVRLVLACARTQVIPLLRKADAELGRPNPASSSGDGLFFGAGTPAGDLALLFPGQGSQYLQMARELCTVFPEFKDRLDSDPDIAAWIFPTPTDDEQGRRAQATELTRTEHAQPALAVIEASMGSLLLDRFGLEPARAAGHSFGELTALFVAGRLTYSELLMLSRQRGQLMASQGRDRGTMLAVSAPLEELAALVAHEGGGLVLANLNTPQQGVLSGPRAAIDHAETVLKARGLTTRRLDVAAAFHSPLVADAQVQLMKVLEPLPLPTGVLTVIANSTGAEYPAEATEAKTLLAEQLAKPVRFVDVVERLYALGTRTFLEVGPRNVLSGLTRQILGSRPHTAVALDPSSGRNGGLLELARALAQLAALGHPVKLEAWEGEPDRAAPPARKLTILLSGANHRDAPKPLPSALKPASPASAAGSGAKPGVVPDRPGAPSSASEQAKRGLSASNPVSGVGQPPGDTRPPPALRPSQILMSAERSVPVTVSTNPKPVRSEHAGFAPHSVSLTSRSELHTTPRISEVMMVDPQHKVRTTAPPPESLAPHFPPGIQGRESGSTSAVAAPSPGLLMEALRAGQEQLRLLQALQAQTASVHQRYLEGQDAASRGFMALVNGQQRMMEHLLLGSSGDAFRLSASEGAVPQLQAFSPMASVTASPQGEHIVPRLSERSGSEGFPFPVSALSGTFGPGAMLPSSQTPGSGERMAPLVVTGLPPQPAPARTADAELWSGAIQAQPGIKSLVQPQSHLHIGSASGLTGPVAPHHGTAAIDLPRTVGGPGHSGMGSASKAESPKSDPTPFIAQPPPAPGVDLSTTLLQVVSELTGYPSSMLGLEMDMESDLGIDSIKRVEILSVLSSRVPGLKAVEPDKLATLRTLQQVLTYLNETRGDRLGKSEARAEHGGAHRLPASAPSPLEPARFLAAFPSIPLQGETPGIQRTMPAGDLASASPVQFLTQVRTKASSPKTGPDPAAVEEPVVATPTPSLPFLERRLRIPVRLEPAPALAPEEYTKALSGHWLVVSASRAPHEGVTTALVDALQAAGAQTHTVNVSSTPQGGVEKLRGILLITADAPLQWNEAGEAALESFFGWTRTNAAALRNRPGGSPALFVTITRQDGMHGLRRVEELASSGHPSPASESQGALAALDALNTGVLDAGLAGLMRTVSQEWTDTIACALDLSPSLPTTDAAKRVVAELALLALEKGPQERSGQAVCTELGLDPEGRVGFAWLPEEVQQQKLAPALMAGDVVVITGGARGVTAACALALARSSQRRRSPAECATITLALVGRSPLPSAEPAWLVNATDEAAIKRAWLEHGFPGEKPSPRAVGEAAARTLAGREIQKTLAELQQTGIHVEYLCADIRQKTAVETALAQLRSSRGSITWLIHGAGCLHDRRIEDKTDTQLREVLSTKVAGLRVLLAALKEDPLKGMVLFSSVSGRFGRKGQSDYAMANRILDRISLACSRQGFPASALAWGPWEGGMVSPGLKREFAKEGIGLIPLEAGAEQLEQEVARLGLSPGPGLILLGAGLGGFLSSHSVGTLNVPAHLASGSSTEGAVSLDIEAQQWLKAHCIGGNPVLPLAKVAEMFVRAAQSRHPGVRIAGIRQLQLLKGVVFEGVTAVPLWIRLTDGEVTPSGRLLLAELLDSAKGVRARALVRLDLSIEPADALALPSSQEEARDLHPFELENVSSGVLPWYSQEWLFHGPHWQVISAVRGISGRQLVLELNPAPGQTILEESQLIDAVFQGLILWSRAQHQLPCLPSGLEELLRHAVLERSELAGPVTLWLNIEQVQGYIVHGSARLTDSSGRPLLSLTGLRATMSPSLVEKFRQTAA